MIFKNQSTYIIVRPIYKFIGYVPDIPFRRYDRISYMIKKIVAIKNKFRHQDRLIIIEEMYCVSY